MRVFQIPPAENAFFDQMPLKPDRKKNPVFSIPCTILHNHTPVGSALKRACYFFCLVRQSSAARLCFVRVSIVDWV
jgi:hypothetical protein